ncbi:MAG: PD40 domain-containing protein [Holophagales bacterium]|nr:PD40 domain-containing protein [Holophagales bacterium]
MATSGTPGAGVGNIDLWLLDTKGAAALRFTLEPTEDVEGTWSPDGKTLFYGSNANGPPDIYGKTVDGAGKAELVHAMPGLQKPTSISRDGRVLIFDSEVDERTSILALDLESRQVRCSARARSTTRTASSPGRPGGSPSIPTRPAGRRSSSRPSPGRDAPGPSRPTGDATRNGAETGGRSSIPRSTAASSPFRSTRSAIPFVPAPRPSSSGRRRRPATTGTGACHPMAGSLRSSRPAFSGRRTS